MRTILAVAGAAFAPVDQHYPFQARQMQALSLAVHIPLVCFGIAFPPMVLFADWCHLRTGDPLFRMLAKRWSKVMLALFAVGAVTGSILSFEFGLLWPGFMVAFGNVFGPAIALEGDRLSPRTHFFSGVPVAIAGVTDLPAEPFYGFNRPGANVLQGFRLVLASRHARVPQSGLPLRQSVLGNRPDEDLKKFDVSTLILHGDDDQIVPINDSAMLSSKIIKGATLKVIPGAPHGMCSALRNQVNAELLAFFKQSKGAVA